YAKERVTFQDEGNYWDTHRGTKLVETAETKLNVLSEIGTLFVVLFLTVQRGLSKENSPL
ncbi:MAG: hypothetical protein MI923_20845, partial [Phycisphaerales bacterium]|nr:hypothetical protein [Phycisphaerales bacterium]